MKCNCGNTHTILGAINIYFLKWPLRSLICMIILTSLLVFYPYIFNNGVFIFVDVGSDTQNVYYPFFISLSRKIANRDFSMWDFSFGLGTNILTRQSDVGNVFTWITLLLGEDFVKYALVYVHILKIIITGIVCYYFLSEFSYVEQTKVLVSYIYAFNGFSILWGQHYFFGSAALYIVLMLLAIEKAMKSTKGYVWVIIASFIMLCNSYYLSYMTLLVAALYTLGRLILRYTATCFFEIIKKSSALIGAVLLGGGMAAFLFLPSVAVLICSSSRLGAGESLLVRLSSYLLSPGYDKATIIGIISRLFSNNLMGADWYVGPLNYYEMPQWFFSSFLLFFFFIYLVELLVNKHIKMKERIVKLLAIAFVICLAFHPFFSVILNGFVAPFFRYTYAIMPLIAILFADILNKLVCGDLQCGKKMVVCAGVIAASVLLIVQIKTFVGSKLTTVLAGLYFLCTLALMWLFILMLRSGTNSRKKAMLFSCVSLIIIFNVTLESFVTTSYGRVPTYQENEKIYITNGNNNVKEALEYIEEEDTSFYRIEKTFADIAFLNDSQLQGYFGISVYNSVINKEVDAFIDEVCPQFGIVTSSGYYDFREIYDQVDFLSLLGVKYILSTEILNHIPEYSYIKTFGDVHLYRNTHCDGIARFYRKAVDYETYVKAKENDQRFALDDMLIMQDTYLPIDDNIGQIADIYFERPRNSSRIIGKVNADYDGWIFLSIPYEEGWKAYVDGKETPIEKADIAFMAVPVSAGKHEVVLQYNTPLLKEGCIISGIAFACFIAVCSIIYKKKRSDGI